ncbi:asparagine synthase (glutamine-hydrolyzing) [Desulfobotulus sp. H1]|uniref:asparagine synthase (glutamine-hydrolyzing) n=1 Tax=Desulfobotulus pelophilus TaxID=2823377 RepID=A0ABT3NCU1_9BACT|nr:asparagine synthase (glutamine-hydrolyzing) [Desulfobotulus pelophilus]MCW7755272.1 asparagine synthase (glutamine-hydrolyzing) [Desulfobotulus pelophilus]
MCGIAGLWQADPTAEVMEKLKMALDRMCNRGPDDKDMFCTVSENQVLGLGHTRLSIIDLSAAGRQPMCSRDGRFSIVLNGEIYNYIELKKILRKKEYVFETETDTEVLLHAWREWGEACLLKLTGMFAFAVYDKLEKTITCARDAFGIKPFFYHSSKGCFAFASTASALMALLPQKPVLNFQKAYDYLVYGCYDNDADSFFSEVNHLLPGHLLQFNFQSKDETIELKRWWWPSIQETWQGSFHEAALYLRQLFLKNIKLHLRTDVPFGAALSGGVDSSAVVCAVRYLNPDISVRTFSYIARGSDIDEEKWVDLVNAYAGALAHKVFVSKENLIRDLDELIQAQDEPFGGTSIYAQYCVFRLAKENGVTVTLDGQGADELLAGYHGYPDARMLSMIEKGEWRKLFAFMNEWASWPGRSRKKVLLSFVSAVLPQRFRTRAMTFMGVSPTPEWLRNSVLKKRGVVFKIPFTQTAGETSRGRRLMHILRSSLTVSGLTPLLRHGDRNSMRFSIESRVPFLTTDVAEFLLSLPEEYLLSDKGQTKYIFREAMRGIVPDSILDRRDKIGFQTPENDWLIEMAPEVRKWLLHARNIDFIDYDNLLASFDAVIDGKIPFTWQVWRWVNFVRWHHYFFSA